MIVGLRKTKRSAKFYALGQLILRFENRTISYRGGKPIVVRENSTAYVKPFEAINRHSKYGNWTQSYIRCRSHLAEEICDRDTPTGCTSETCHYRFICMTAPRIAPV